MSKEKQLKEGDKVNFHQVANGPITSTEHEIELIQDQGVEPCAYITGKSNPVLLENLSPMEKKKKESEKKDDSSKGNDKNKDKDKEKDK